MKRLCIFSFYDKDGKADNYIAYLLNDLLSQIDRLIVVVNGYMTEDSKTLFKRYTDEIVVRPNLGYDAGAYKHVLMKLGNEEIKKYDQLVLCNDTFFGPFHSFEKIFNKMEKEDCDFWGLSGIFDSLFPHIQSFFLVFKEKIIQEGLVYDYFQEYVDGECTEINTVYCQFETGLFDWLSRIHNMKYAIYAKKSDYDTYAYSFENLLNYNLQLVKKKTFYDYEKEKDNIWCTLSYIKFKTSYDIDLVLECICRNYGLEIKKEDILDFDYYRKPKKNHIMTALVTEKEIENFIAHADFYIYGTGMYAYKVYWRFARDYSHCKGFVVSDGNRKNEKYLFGLPIYEFSEITDIGKRKIILGLSDKFSDEVYAMFDNKENVMKIY